MTIQSDKIFATVDMLTDYSLSLSSAFLPNPRCDTRIPRLIVFALLLQLLHVLPRVFQTHVRYELHEGE